jgi:predicted Zn-dependent protease
MSLRANNQYHEALSDFNRILDQEPEDVEVVIHMAETKVEMKDYLGAIEDYTYILKYDSTNAMVYFRRAQAKKLANDLEGFEKDMARYKQMCTRIMKTRGSGSEWGREREQDGSFDENEVPKLVDDQFSSE